MRKSLALLAAAAVVAAGSTAWAGPKDKVQEALVDPTSVDGTAGQWDNDVTSGKVKQGKCKMQVQMKDLPGGTFPDGTVVICVASADVKSALLPPAGGGNSIVMAGATKKGKLNLKGDLAQITCGSVGQALSYNGEVACYLDDGVFVGADDLTNWKKSCTDAGMAPIPMAGGFKPDNLVGLCQGFAPGLRIVPPASTVIAVQGQLTQ